VNAAVAQTHGYVLAYRIAGTLIAIGGVLVLILLRRWMQHPANRLWISRARWLRPYSDGGLLRHPRLFGSSPHGRNPVEMFGQADWRAGSL